MTRHERLDHIQGSMTARQAAVLWMEEAHRFPTMSAYSRSLQGKPEKEYPLYKLTAQVEHAVRQAARNEPRETVEWRVRQAIKDVVFLFHLHQGVNGRVEVQKDEFALKLLVLWERLTREIDEQRHAEVLWNAHLEVCFGMPYPLDPETAATVAAAVRRHVLPWKEMEDLFEGWLAAHFVRQGRTELPLAAYVRRSVKDETAPFLPTVEEVKALFKGNAKGYEAFMAGSDHSHGLADVTDAEFRRHHDAMVLAARQLVESGEVQEGVTVTLPTAPMRFLRRAPLVEAAWLDRGIAELAEWGALMRKDGSTVREAEDDHPLAWDSFAGADGGDADRAKAKSREEARNGLQRFPGRVREVDGRPHVRFEDYVAWKGRQASVDKGAVQRGVPVAAWNAWVDQHGGEGVAAVGGVPVRRVACRLEPEEWRACASVEEAATRLERREWLLATLRPPKDAKQGGEGGPAPAPASKTQVHWSAIRARYLCDLYSLSYTVSAIGRRYFEGREVLFSETAKALKGQLESAELLAVLSKDALGPEGGVVDLAAVRRDAEQAAVRVVAVVVDMAKAETLEQMGERASAIEIASKYL